MYSQENPSLLSTKSFVRLHNEHGDIIYKKPNNDCFCDMIERVQYNVALARHNWRNSVENFQRTWFWILEI